MEPSLVHRSLWTRQDESSQFVSHPDHRSLSTFFLGFLFSIALTRLLRFTYRSFITRQTQSRLSIHLVYSDPLVLPSENSTPKNLRGHYLVAMLTAGYSVAALARFLSLLDFGSGSDRGWCATLTISSGLLADFARIIGLVKLGIDIRLLGARAFEMWSLWAAVILMFGSTIAEQALSPAALDIVPELPNLALCYQTHSTIASVVVSALGALVSAYTLLRLFFIVTLSSSTLVSAGMTLDVRVAQALAMLVYSIVTLPSRVLVINLPAYFVPFSLGASLVVAVFNHVPVGSSRISENVFRGTLPASIQPQQRVVLRHPSIQSDKSSRVLLSNDGMLPSSPEGRMDLSKRRPSLTDSQGVQIATLEMGHLKNEEKISQPAFHVPPSSKGDSRKRGNHIIPRESLLAEVEKLALHSGRAPQQEGLGLSSSNRTLPPPNTQRRIPPALVITPDQRSYNGRDRVSNPELLPGLQHSGGTLEPRLPPMRVRQLQKQDATLTSKYNTSPPSAFNNSPLRSSLHELPETPISPSAMTMSSVIYGSDIVRHRRANSQDDRMTPENGTISPGFRDGLRHSQSSEDLPRNYDFLQLDPESPGLLSRFPGSIRSTTSAAPSITSTIRTSKSKKSFRSKRRDSAPMDGRSARRTFGEGSLKRLARWSQAPTIASSTFGPSAPSEDGTEWISLEPAEEVDNAGKTSRKRSGRSNGASKSSTTMMVPPPLPTNPRPLPPIPFNPLTPPTLK